MDFPGDALSVSALIRAIKPECSLVSLYRIARVTTLACQYRIDRIHFCPLIIVLMMPVILQRQIACARRLQEAGLSGRAMHPLPEERRFPHTG